MNKAIAEGVVIVYADDEKTPSIMIRGNGTVEWYRLEKMGLSDVSDFLGAGRVQPMEGNE